MVKKQEAMELGFNKAGMEQGSKRLFKFFAGLGVMFGLLLMIFIWWAGLAIIAFNAAMWYVIDKSKAK